MSQYDRKLIGNHVDNGGIYFSLHDSDHYMVPAPKMGQLYMKALWKSSGKDVGAQAPSSPSACA